MCPHIMRMSIKAKLAIISAAMIILAALSIGYLSYSKSQAMMLDFTAKNLSTQARILAAQVDRYLSNRSNEILALAQNPGLRDPELPAAEKSIILRENKESYGNFESIALTDARGLQFADSDGFVGVMKDDLEWFQAGMRGEMYISDVRISRDLNKPVINFGYPVRDRADRIIGVLNARLDLEDTVWDLVDQFADLEREAGRTGYAYMVNRDGDFIAHPQREMILRDNILTAGDEELKTVGGKMMRGEEGVARYIFENEDKYTVFTPLTGWGDYAGQGWSIALTSPVDEFLAPVYQLRHYNLLIGAAVVILGLVLALFFAQRMVAPISQLLVQVQEVAKGDLTQNVTVASRDEIGALGTAFNDMVSNLHETVSGLQSNSVKLSAHSQELTATGQQVGATVEELASTTNQVAATTAQSADGSRRAEQESENMRVMADEGNEAVQNALDKINAIAANTRSIAGVIDGLGEQSRKIGQIIGAITGIADQTNLLALNAAIEAARAGEQGRGFAVVAEEVRKLAEQSGAAAAEITDLVRQIQQGVEQSVTAMDAGMADVDEGVELAQTAGAALNKINEAIDRNTVMIKDLATGADEVNEGTQQLAAAHQEIASTFQEVIVAAQELTNIAQELQDSAAAFKLNA